MRLNNGNMDPAKLSHMNDAEPSQHDYYKNNTREQLMQ